MQQKPLTIAKSSAAAGKLSFSFFSGNSIDLVANNKTTHFDFEPLKHVQQPMIEKVVQYFLGEAANPCTAEEGAEVMRWMGEMTSIEYRTRNKES